jgi:predicted transcriptional regulator of viral defense system
MNDKDKITSILTPNSQNNIGLGTRPKNLLNLLTNSTKTVFTTQDFNKIWQYKNYRSLIQRISYLTKTGKLQRLQRGLYAITNRPVNDLELANKLKTPSYISFETVLYKEGVIFQWDNRITLAGQDSREMQIQERTIVFRKIKDEILLNPTGIIQKGNYAVASKERALLDMLYIAPNFTFDNLRGIDFEIIRGLLNIYSRDSIKKVIRKLEEYAGSY